jgi:hypothetical protein
VKSPAKFNFVSEPFAAKRLLSQLVKRLNISVLTTDRSTLMKSMMRYVTGTMFQCFFKDVLCMPETFYVVLHVPSIVDPQLFLPDSD